MLALSTTFAFPSGGDGEGALQLLKQAEIGGKRFDSSRVLRPQGVVSSVTRSLASFAER